MWDEMEELWDVVGWGIGLGGVEWRMGRGVVGCGMGWLKDEMGSGKDGLWVGLVVGWDG